MNEHRSATVPVGEVGWGGSGRDCTLKRDRGMFVSSWRVETETCIRAGIVPLEGIRHLCVKYGRKRMCAVGA